MSGKEKAGRPFERLAAAVQKKLDVDCEVYSPHVVIGRSGSRITLDGAVIGKIGSAAILVAIEAKDYAEPVGVEKVRAFVTATKDIRANHGIMVAPLGFTRDALLTECPCTRCRRLATRRTKRRRRRCRRRWYTRSAPSGFVQSPIIGQRPA
jgi:hypothetical protein